MKEHHLVITQGKELIVRKRVVTFVEKLFRHLGYDFDHDYYKNIAYAESPCKTKLDFRLKCYYDAYHYLLSNRCNPLTQELLGKFLYICLGKQADSFMLMRVPQQYFEYQHLPHLEHAIELHLAVYLQMSDLDDETRLIASLMLFNYMLCKGNIPVIRLIDSQITQYLIHHQEYLQGDKQPIYLYLTELVMSSQYQDKTYYDNLIPLTLAEIRRQLVSDRDTLTEQYGIDKLYIFGSFAKEQQRIDSDIDLLVVFSDDYGPQQKIRTISYLQQHYLDKLHRYIDITEVSLYVTDDILKELPIICRII